MSCEQLAELLAGFDRLLTGVAGAAESKDEVDFDEIDDRFGEAGLYAPEEARAWWNWRNREIQIGPALELLPLNSALAMRAGYMKLALKATAWSEGGLDPESFWPSRWVPLLSTGSAPVVALDTANPSGPSPLYYHSPHQATVASKPDPWFASVADFIRVWAGGIRQGLATYQDDRWSVLDAGLAASMRTSPSTVA